MILPDEKQTRFALRDTFFFVILILQNGKIRKKLTFFLAQETG